MTWRPWGLVVAAAGMAGPLAAQPGAELWSGYTKQEVMIPMRDGVRLFTSIYVPQDSGTKHPILLRRTPYTCGPYGADAFAPGVGRQQARHMREGYIIVCQDVRGAWMSEGSYANVRPYLPVKRGKRDVDETTDTYDTVEWLIRNLKTSNGRVGISGVSYPGFYTWMGTIDAHPAVKATSPQAPVSKWMGGDDFYHNGALLLPHAFNFFANFGRVRTAPTTERQPGFDHGTPDEYAFFLRMGPLANANAKYFHGEIPYWDSLTANDRWNEYWAARDVLQYLKDTRPATLVVGGWFDTENLYGALNSYQVNERLSPNAQNRLVMGPWSHGQWNARGDSLGPIGWDQETAAFYTDSIEGPFFDHYLKNTPTLDLPEAFVFNTGSKQWGRFDAWPPVDVMTKTLWLEAGSGLRLGGGGGNDGSDGNDGRGARSAPMPYDEYVHDPGKPVPYTNQITGWYNAAFMLEDQRFAARRPDVLVYQTEPLAEDVTIAGPIRVRFTVSTSGTDADWVVKLIDVFPDDMDNTNVRARRRAPGVRLGGYQMLVRGDVLRGKFRNSLAAPEPFVPDQPTAISFTLQDAFHTFKAGHRIMIQVQSSWFPMIDLNPGTFVRAIEATPEDFRKTVQRVYRSPERPSYVELTVLP
jgi:uncharacterized protein